MFKITTNLRVDKLVKKIASQKSRDLLISLYAEEIAEESRKYITQGKVKPAINQSTAEHRERKQRATANKPLFFSRNFLNKYGFQNILAKLKRKKYKKYLVIN